MGKLKTICENENIILTSETWSKMHLMLQLKDKNTGLINTILLSDEDIEKLLKEVNNYDSEG